MTSAPRTSPSSSTSPTDPDRWWQTGGGVSDRRWRHGRVRPTGLAEWIAGTIALGFVGVIAMVLSGLALTEFQAGSASWTLGTFVGALVVLSVVQSWIRLTLRRLLVRGLTLVLDPFPGSPGGHVGGSVEIASGDTDPSRYVVRLACIRADHSGDSTSRRIVWAAEGQPQVERVRRGQVRLTFTFDVPESVPPTNGDGKDRHQWSLSLRGARTGPDLSAEFPVPVLLGEPRQAAQYAPVQPIGTAERPHDRVRMRSDFDGVRVDFLRGRQAKLGGIAILFGAGFAGAGAFLSSAALRQLSGNLVGALTAGAMGLMALAFIGIGLMIVGAGMAAALGRSSLTFNAKHIRIAGSLRRSKTIPLSDIERIEATVDGQLGQGAASEIGYRMTAFLSAGAKVKLASGIPGPGAVRTVAERVEAETGVRVSFPTQ